MASAGKTAVVTGSTGLVGSHLVAELTSREYARIILPVRDASRIGRLHETLRREGIETGLDILEPVETPLTEAEHLAGIFRGADMVFHCAAAVSLGGMDGATLIDGNLRLTSAAVEAALRAGVEKFIHVSSIASLGEAPKPGTPIDESMSPESPDELSDYGKGKYLSEQVVRQAESRGLRTVIVNPAVILGAGDWKSGSTAMIPLLASGIPFYTGGVSAFVDVRDVARAMAELAECREADGERFVLSAGNISYRELLEAAALASGKKPPRWEISGSALRIAALAERFVCMVRGKRRQLTKEMISVLFKNCNYDGTKIKKTLNFEYTPLRETIGRVVDQYISERR